jgi:hypothetical protein
MIWTFRIFFVLLVALCVEAHLNKVHAKKGPPEMKKFWELYNDKKVKYSLGLCFLLNNVVTFQKKFFVYSLIKLRLAPNYANPTNQKGQMPPRRLFILTRGIQIRGQPIKNLKNNF